MQRFTLKAPAKINLLLAVSPVVIQKKHTLTSVFSTIDLCDYLSFSFEDGRERSIDLDLEYAYGIPKLDLPLKQNIVYRALVTFEQCCGKTLSGHLHVKINKAIPAEGGLAGGSTNAATTLLALARLWDIDPLSAPVLEAASCLGADVAFFLYAACGSGCALMGGDGSKLLQQLPQPTLDLVLVKPQTGVSTAAAYAVFAANPQPEPNAVLLVSLLESGTATHRLIATRLANNLTAAACTLLPELTDLIDELSAQKGVYVALMSGSGSTVFGVCENSAVAARTAAQFAAKGYWATAAKT